MHVHLLQLNPVIGDVSGNLARIIDAIDAIGKKHKEGVQLIIGSELGLIGYPPKDLLRYQALLDTADQALDQLAKHLKKYPDLAVIIGSTRQDAGELYNSAFLLSNGAIQGHYDKQCLATDDVFDEYRYFSPGAHDTVFEIAGYAFGMSICEDIWQGAENFCDGQDLDAIINLSASPFEIDKEIKRDEIFKELHIKHSAPIIYVNQVGANEEIIFDGASRVMNGQGKVQIQLSRFSEDIQSTELFSTTSLKGTKPGDAMADVHDALVFGIRDYMKKTGFTSIILGVSGGIDSAVTAALAVHAIGAENVHCVAMPSAYSSQGSVDDAEALIKALGCDYESISIRDLVTEYQGALNHRCNSGVAEENLQSRIRGTMLMALSNQFGHLLVSTGNKSELAVGYCTLYGDMNGGLSILGDLYKTEVYALAEYINRDRIIIPQNTIDKAPSAELRPDQKDQDTLPAYEVLDRIIHDYVELSLDADQIQKASGYDKEIIDWVIRKINLNEYKRWQAAPVLRLRNLAFGTGRRISLTTVIS